jgi:hypothetical protein
MRKRSIDPAVGGEAELPLVQENRVELTDQMELIDREGSRGAEPPLDRGDRIESITRFVDRSIDSPIDRIESISRSIAGGQGVNDSILFSKRVLTLWASCDKSLPEQP